MMDTHGAMELVMLSADLGWAIIGAVAAGAVIGAEREYRATPAGLRTHILVSLSCCLLMLSAVHQLAWLHDTPIELIRIDPVRMAHGILTGIGFLCGGVIFREGFNVRGLTTAASLWTTATLGVLIGIGFYELAILGTVATVLVLAAVTITERFVPQRRIVHLKVRYRRTEAVSKREFGAMLSDHDLKVITTHQRAYDEVLEHGAIANGYNEDRDERLSAKLTNDPAVVGYEIVPQSA
jgi:putative Mg2+ transporter-C (MgtC) family protein